MIFTRRFGALAAFRRQLPVTETEVERDFDVLTHDTSQDEHSHDKAA